MGNESLVIHCGLKESNAGVKGKYSKNNWMYSSADARLTPIKANEDEVKFDSKPLIKSTLTANGGSAER